MNPRSLVLDTNVLISAFLSPQGVCKRLLNSLANENAVLLFSDATYQEFMTRIVRPKFTKYYKPEQLENVVSHLAEVGHWHEPTLQIAACRDAQDDKFLALAVSAKAEFLITGDQDLLVLHPFENVCILTPRVFLEDHRSQD